MILSDLERGRVADAIRLAATRSGNWLAYADAAIEEIAKIKAEHETGKPDEPPPPNV